MYWTIFFCWLNWRTGFFSFVKDAHFQKKCIDEMQCVNKFVCENLMEFENIRLKFHHNIMTLNVCFSHTGNCIHAYDEAKCCVLFLKCFVWIAGTRNILYASQVANIYTHTHILRTQWLGENANKLGKIFTIPPPSDDFHKFHVVGSIRASCYVIKCCSP